MTTAQDLQHKVEWNSHRSKKNADFYTIGYSHYRMPDFLVALQDVGISTVIDIRYDAVSMHRPEFSKSNLRRLLAENGIAYIHRRDLGVPRDIRVQTNRDRIWEWYDNRVQPITTTNLNALFGEVACPIALMCVEADPRECHRHRLAVRLEQNGLRSYDL